MKGVLAAQLHVILQGEIMTIQEFDKHRFSAGSKVTYQGEVYTVSSVDFDERLICLDEGDNDSRWVRCENCEMAITRRSTGRGLNAHADSMKC